MGKLGAIPACSFPATLPVLQISTGATSRTRGNTPTRSPGEHAAVYDVSQKLVAKLRNIQVATVSRTTSPIRRTWKSHPARPGRTYGVSETRILTLLACVFADYST